MKYPISSYNTPLPGYGTSLVDRINLYLHFRRYFRIISDRWLLLVVFSALGLGVSTWMAMSKPDIYEARSRLATLPKVTVAGASSTQIEDDNQRLGEASLIRMNSAIVLNRVNERFAEGSGTTNLMALPNLVARVGPGNTFILTVRSTNLDYARRFATIWAEEFIEYKKLERSGLLLSAESSTQKEILRLEKDLALARDDLEDYKRRHSIANFRDTGLRLREALEGAKSERQRLEVERKIFESATREEAVELLSKQADRSVSAPARGDGARRSFEDDGWRGAGQSIGYTRLRLELSNMEGLLERHSRDLKPKHPYMVDLANSIEAKKAEIEETLRLTEQQRMARVNELRQREDALGRVIEELTLEALESTERENDYESLVKQELYLKEELDLARRRQQSLTRLSGDDAVFEILERGGGSPAPVAPKRPEMILSGFGAGLAVGVGLLFLLHRLDDRLENPEEIEQQLDEPILGQLPEVDKKHFREGYLMLTRMKSHTMFAESLRGIRSALLLSPEGTSKRLIAVTSAVPGDGKTTFTVNFAIILANSGNKTLLIDADLRRGNINSYFDQPLEGGLSEVLEAGPDGLTIQEAIRETPVNNLFFMRAGKRPSNPSELLIGNNTKDVIMQLRREFDYVIFDCPPLTAIDDPFSLAAYLDGIFFVIRAGKTSIRFARMSMNTIRQRGAPTLGLIINGVPIDNPYYYYTTYYYASYYHRSVEPDENLYQQDPRKGRSERSTVPAVNTLEGQAGRKSADLRVGDSKVSKQSPGVDKNV